MGTSRDRNDKYELVAPDGGWAYMVTSGISVMLTVVIVPVSCFALIFGPFLSQLQDEASATSIVTAVYVTVFHISGLLAHFLFKKLSYRKIALLGSFLYFSGSFASIFVTNLNYMIISYGVVQGLGVGLILPSCLSAANEYFDRKKPLAMAMGQAAMALMSIVFPGFTRLLLENYGFRGTQAIFSAISLHAVLGALTLQPVEWHMKRKLKVQNNEPSDENSSERHYEIVYSPVTEEMDSKQLLQCSGTSMSSFPDKLMKSTTSLASFGSTIYYPFSRPEGDSRNLLRRIVDFSLLKDILYWNVAIGLSLSTISEMNFTAILPVFLVKIGFSNKDITLVMTAYFTSDLATRIILTVVTAFCSFSIRKLFLINIIFTIIIRFVFAASHSFWITVTLGTISGLSRCLIQVPIPMVMAEEFCEKFSSAISLFMAITGVLSVIMGATIGFVKYKTDSNVMVLHLLTGIFFVCLIPWTIEYVYKYLKSKQKKAVALLT